MIIYFNNTHIDIDVSDSSYRYRAIKGDNSLTLYFSLYYHIEIPVGAYCDFQGQRYTLEAPENFKMNNTRNFEYTVILESSQAKAKKYKFINPVDRRLKFNLTAKPREHLQMFIDNMNIRDSGWTIGRCIDAPEKLISYSHSTCMDALNQQADTFETEYEFNGREVSLCKVEYNRDHPLPLSYGRGNGFKPGVGRTNFNDRNPVEVLYIQGGEKNIDSSTYKNRELLLPKNQILRYDGKFFEGEQGFNALVARTYISDTDGISIRRQDKPLKSNEEESLDLSHIYPSRIGIVTSVVSVNTAKNFYDIIDNTIPQELDFSSCLIAGEKSMSIIFQSGMLAGKEFDVKYFHEAKTLSGVTKASRRFEIVPQEIDHQLMPNDVFVPKVGDKYAVFNCMLPSAYICDNITKSGASWEMFKEAAKYLYENEEQKFTFNGELDGIWAKRDWENIGGKIKLGGCILFSDPQFQPDGVIIRIVGIKDYINNPYKPEIELSNSITGSSIISDLRKIESNEVLTESMHKEALQFTKRKFRDAKETMTMIESALLDSFSQSISPIAVQTMALLVGDESLQFRFVSNSVNPSSISHQVLYDTQSKILTVQSGTIQHLTLGIKTLSSGHTPNEYRFWTLPQFSTPPLAEKEKRYYLYAKVSAADQSGVFYISEKAIKIDSEIESYHLLLGILNSEYEGERSYVSLYGYTEILPGRMTIDKIVSSDGKTYFDILQGIIAGRIKFVTSSGYAELADWANDITGDIQETQSSANAAAIKAQHAIENAQSAVVDYNAKFAAIQAQIDGEVSNWFYNYSPTLSNYPASVWNTAAEKERHIGDTFTNTQSAPAVDAGKSWRFLRLGSAYEWKQICDSDAVKALQQAAKAQATADGKSTTYMIQPTAYRFGDTWILGEDRTINGVLYKRGESLQASRDSTTFVETHWIKQVRYTDDSAIDRLKIGVSNILSGTSFATVGWYSDRVVTSFENRIQKIRCIDSNVGDGFLGKKFSIPQEYLGREVTFSVSVSANWNISFRLRALSSTLSVWSESFVTKNPETGLLASLTFIPKERETTLYLYTSSIIDLSLHDGFMLVEGSKAVRWRASDLEIESSISDAKNASISAQTTANNAQTAANNANTAVGNLSSYVNGAFRDGLITAAEAAAIEKYKNSILESKISIQASYDKIFSNPYLEGEAKSHLSSTKNTLDTAITNLLSSITVAIADGTTTVEEKADVDNKYALYVSSLSTYNMRIEEANIAIQNKIRDLAEKGINSLQVADRNLLLNSEARTANRWSPSTCNVTSVEARLDGVKWTRVNATANGEYKGLCIYQVYNLSDIVETMWLGKDLVFSTMIRGSDNIGAQLSMRVVIEYVEGTENKRETFYGESFTATYSNHLAIVKIKNFPYQLSSRNVRCIYFVIDSLSSDWSGKALFIRGNMISFGSVVCAWSPAKEDIESKIEAAQLYVEYSVNGSSGWHTLFTSGDLYMRQKNGANGTWSSAIRIVGESGLRGLDGKYTDYQFAKGTSTVAPVTGWQDAPPVALSNEYVWMRKGVVVPPAVSPIEWSMPIRLKGDKGESGEILTGGNILHHDPTFKTGMNGVVKYASSAGSSNVTLTRIAKPSDAPTNSTHILRLENRGTANPATPRIGGFAFYTQSRSNAVFVVKIIAKIPTGRELLFVDNAAGTGYKAVWLTSNVGTGQYETYIHRITCGYGGTLSTTNIFDITGNSGSPSVPLTVDIAYATVFDMSDEDSMTAIAMRSKAVTDKLGTSIHGGLISSVIMELRDIGENSKITAGMSGIQGSDNSQPAIWTGGSIAEAVGMRAKVVFNHNGTGKVGELFINNNGELYTIADGKVRFLINADNITSLDSLKNESSMITPTVRNTFYSNSVNSYYEMPNKMTITADKAGSQFKVVTGLSASASIESGSPQGYRSIAVSLMLYRNGVKYADIGHCIATATSNGGIDTGGGIIDNPIDNVSTSVNTAFNSVPEGVYSLVVNVTCMGALAGTSVARVNASTMDAILNRDIEQFRFGRNGMMAFYGKDKFMYLNKDETPSDMQGNNGQPFFNLRGSTDIPGVLATGSVNSDQVQSNVWGAKANNNTVLKLSVGSYRIPHNIGHAIYTISAIAAEEGAVISAPITSRTATYFEIRITKNGSRYDSGFEYALYGKN